MRKIREVLRLKFDAGLSVRKIAASLSIGPSSAGDYLCRFAASGLQWPIDISDAELNRRLFPPAVPVPTDQRPMPDWAWVHAELRRPGVTLALLWQEYRLAYPQGFQYSWFCEHYRLWAAKVDVVMRQEHRAGEKLLVDYAGQTAPVIDRQTGEIRQAQIFVAVLGASSYELDLFGRVHNLGTEALETYLSTVETRRSTQITLVSEVASDWLTLGADQRLLALARQTEDSQQHTYDLVQQVHALGGTDGLELAEAQASLQSARNDVAVYLTEARQARDALELVVGVQVAPGDLPDAQVDPVSSLRDLPAGVPSTVLEQRPDVLSAEHSLKATYADIGAARANFFPRISLTAALGTESSALSGLFGGDSRAWSFSPSVTLPIFDAGANRATLEASKASRDIAVATYEKTLQAAFSEVADSLAVRATIAERLDAQTQTVAADQRAYDLSMVLYRQGGDSLLDTLTEQRLLYAAQQSLVGERVIMN